MKFSFICFVLVTINLIKTSPIPQNSVQQPVVSNGATFTPVTSPFPLTSGNTQLASTATNGIPISPMIPTMTPGGQVFLGPNGQLMTTGPQGAPLGSVVLPNTATPNRINQNEMTNSNQALISPPIAPIGGQLIAPSGIPITSTNTQLNPTTNLPTNQFTNPPLVPAPGLPRNQGMNPTTTLVSAPASQPNLATNIALVPGPGLPTNPLPRSSNNPNQPLQSVTLNPKNNVQFIGNPPTMINTQTGRPTTTITQTTTSNTRPENSPTNLMNQVGGGGGGGLLNAQVNLPFSLGGFGINLSNGFSPNPKPSASMMMNPINHPSVLQTTVESIETVQLNRSKDEQINRELVDHRAVEDEEEKPVEVGEGGADEESERG